MISADDFTCRVPADSVDDLNVLNCTTGAPGGLEIAGFIIDIVVACGTVGAAAVALWLGVRGIKEQRGMEDRAVDRQRSNDWYQQMVKLQDAAETVRMSFPAITNQQYSEYERELNRYLGFCDARNEESGVLAEAVRYNNALFSGIVHKWNGYDPVEVVTEEQKKLDNEVYKAGIYLEMSSSIFTAFLVWFHQGQQTAQETSEGMKKQTGQLFDVIGVETLAQNLPDKQPEEPSNDGSRQ